MYYERGAANVPSISARTSHSLGRPAASSAPRTLAKAIGIQIRRLAASRVILIHGGSHD
jgi:hypothetical protein